MCIEPAPSREQGMTLVELVVFIVVVSVGLAGILGVLNLTTSHSADPMIQKQQLAIAQSLLKEVESKPFTFCDPDDANVETATVTTLGAGGCATSLQGIGPTGAESRADALNPFDNVGDYNGFAMNGITTPDGTAVSGLENYTANVAVSWVDPATLATVASNSGALRIDVTVNAPGLPDLTLTGYRFGYAPNSP